MNLLKTFIAFMFLQSNASFLDSAQFRYYKTPRLVVKNHSTYVNKPRYLYNKNIDKVSDKITLYSHPIDHSKKRHSRMTLGETIINRRILLGTIYALIVMYVSKIDPPDPPDEPPQRRPKYNVFKKPLWAPVNATLTDKQYDILYKVCTISWTLFLFYFVNLKF